MAVTLAGALSALGAASSNADAATSSVSLAPGVRMYHQTYVRAGRHQSVYWVQQRFSAATSLVVATPRHLMGAQPMSTLALGRQEHAVAGLNGDTFYFDKSDRGPAYNPSLGPRGGVMSGGYTLKAPLDDQNAVFSITRDGRAHIGPVGFAAHVTGATGGTRKIASLNSIETAWNGNITLTDTRRLDHAMPSSCSEVLLHPTGGGHYRVTANRTHVTHYTRISSPNRALLTCRGPYDNVGYFAQHLRPGTTVTLDIGYRVPGLVTLVSGVRQLVRNGRVFHDDLQHRALNVYGDEHKPETFVCVPRDRRGVSIGVFEGARPGAVGVTYAEESQWLVAQHCWEAMAVDGSTSSTLVAQRPGGHLAVQNRPTGPYPGGQRPQTDGIFIVRR